MFIAHTGYLVAYSIIATQSNTCLLRCPITVNGAYTQVWIELQPDPVSTPHQCHDHRKVQPAEVVETNCHHICKTDQPQNDFNPVSAESSAKRSLPHSIDFLK